ncbi:MAG: hypothetical protein V3T83_12120 [Acidobacteriota bacterium]
MSLEHSEEQQQSNRRGTRCELHGIYFNPDSNDGCVLCQRAAAQEKKSPRAIPLTAAVLALVLVALLVSAQMRRSPVPSAEASTSPQPAAQTQSGKLDPEPFRQEIEDLEKTLYDPAPSGFATADRVSSAALQLGTGLRDQSAGLKTSGAMTRILAFASRTGAEGDAGYSTLDLPRTRQRWERLRNDIFLSADWFRQSTQQLTEAQTRQPPQVDRMLLSTMQKAARDLELLIVKGRPEAKSFGEPYVDAPERSAELRRLGQQWNRWSRRWIRQLDRIGSRFPAQPPLDGDPRLLNAYNRLGEAMRHLSAIPYGANDSGITFRARRMSLFEQAQHAIDQAQDTLSKI